MIPLNPGVAMTVGRGDQVTLRIQQTEVDRPGIDADAVQAAGFGGLAQAYQDFLVEPLDIPAQAPVTLDRPVRKPVDLDQRELAGADGPDDTGPLVAPRSTAATLTSPTATAQRRKAAATPASTGMCSPVVWLRS